MQKEPLYLFNAPEDPRENTPDTLKQKNLDDIFNRPLTGEDIAYKVMKAQEQGVNPNLTIEEFRLYEPWKAKQEIDWWEMASNGIGVLAEDVNKARQSWDTRPVSWGGKGAEGYLNMTLRQPATMVEGLARGTRDLGHMISLGFNHPSSPFSKWLMPSKDEEERFKYFNELADFDAKSVRIMQGKENVLLPDPIDTSKLLGEDASKLSPSYLFGVNQAMAQASSYVLDPTVLASFGGSIPVVASGKAAVKAGLKGALKGVGNKIITAGMKEGISSTASALKNTFSHLDKAKVVGRKVLEKTGSAFRVAGENIEKPFNYVYEGFKKVGADYFDMNLHGTGSGAIRTTGAASGVGGFGGGLFVASGLGLTIWQIPYASMLLPIWAGGQAAKIGGRFFEAVGKEMANGVGVLSRVAKRADATGRLAKVANRWTPYADYITELSKTTAKAGAWGAGLGYLSMGEEGAAGGLGQGLVFGVGGYHVGLAHNMFHGNSKEQMSVRFASHVDELKAGGFTQNADKISAHLERVRREKGDNEYYRELGAYIGLVDNPDVAVQMVGNSDILRMIDDENNDPIFRKELLSLIGNRNAWNGLFIRRDTNQGKSPSGVPYFIVPSEGKQTKTHVVINMDAVTGDKKVQSTGIRGEFYHTLMDINAQVKGKSTVINEVVDVHSRALNASIGDKDQRAMYSESLRNAFRKLYISQEQGPLKQQGNYKKPVSVPKEGNITARAKNLLKIAQQHAPEGFTVKHTTATKGKAFLSIEEGKVKRPAYRWEHSNGTVYENADGTYTTEVGGNKASQHNNLAEAFADFRKQEAPVQGEAPPNVKGERTDTAPEQDVVDHRIDNKVETAAERIEAIEQAIDAFEKDGTINPRIYDLLEELGETVWLATEADAPFDWVFLHGDLGFARNMVEEVKHRLSNAFERNGRQHGFLPDYTKPFAQWGFDKDGKPVTDMYMRKVFSKFLKTHKDYTSNLNGWQVDLSKMSKTHLMHFIAENGLEEEFVQNELGGFERKSDEALNQQNHVKYQAAVNGLVELEKAGIDTGMEFYAIDEKSVPETGSLDEESGSGALRQAGWQEYRTTADDIRDAQKKGIIPTKEEMQEQLKKRVFGKRGRPRTGEIDELIATAKKGSIVFVGIPTMEAFKVLQKHLPKRDMQHLAQLAPLILDGGTTKNNIVRVKYAGFQTSPETGAVLKRPKNTWVAQEKNMVFHAMELRATMRNPKSGKYDYKKPHAAFLLRGVDIDVIQRRILWMWKNERSVRKRWKNHTEFEKDVYRLIENYSMKDAMGGSNFFGGGDEGASKKRLACAAIGAFPTKEMQGIFDEGDVEYTVPEIDWHHYQLSGYGKGNAGRDIPWTNLRLDNIKQLNDAEGMLRMPYAERAYYRAQALFQQGERLAPREGDDIPAVVKVVSFEGDNVKQAIEDADKNYSPSKTLRDITQRGKLVKPSSDIANLLAYVRGGIGHDSLLDKPIVYWHGFGDSQAFDTIDRGQVGLHFGSREQAIRRNFELGVVGQRATDALIPIVTNIKKPLRMPDLGSWTGHTIAKGILEVQDGYAKPFEIIDPSSKEGIELKRQIGQLSPSEIKHLEEYVLDQEQKGLDSLDVVGIRTVQNAKTIYKASAPVHLFLEHKGFDAIVYQNIIEGKGDSYIAFKPTSIKDIVRNRGTYNSREASVLRQQGWTFGATNPEQARALKANWDKAIKEGDIFKAVSIKNNFLGDMPKETVVIRQTVEEAMVQGITKEQYESQFVTGKPVAFVALHGFPEEKAFKEHIVQGKPFNKRSRSAYNGMFWTGDMETAKHYGYRTENGKSAQARAIIKMKNPLVLDFAGMNEMDKALKSGIIDKEGNLIGSEAEFNKISPAYDDLNATIMEAVRNGHDGVIGLNINDSAGNFAQYVVPHDFTQNNIAVIDSSLDTRPVGRGLGVNVEGRQLSFRQQNSPNQSPEEWKPTFYSAVERFVQEKVTDKTPVEQLLAIMDPAKGTGLAKAELTWLDIAGWVDREKAAGKKKVDKQALLDYINANKVEIQELRPEDTKSGMSQYTEEQQQQLMANPQIQEILSTNYKEYTATEKGFDAQPTENYRVFIIRGKQGEVYGFTGHWSDPENIIAHLRTIDSYLTKDTESIPSNLRGRSKAPETRYYENKDNTTFISKYAPQREYYASFETPYSRITSVLNWHFYPNMEMRVDNMGNVWADFNKSNPEDIAKNYSAQLEYARGFKNVLSTATLQSDFGGGKIVDMLYYLEKLEIDASEDGTWTRPYQKIIEDNAELDHIKGAEFDKEGLSKLLDNLSTEKTTKLLTEIFSKIQEDNNYGKVQETQGVYKLLNFQESQSDTAQAISKTRRSVRSAEEETRFVELTYRLNNERKNLTTSEMKELRGLKEGRHPHGTVIATAKEAKKLGLDKIELSKQQLTEQKNAETLRHMLTGSDTGIVDQNTITNTNKNLVRGIQNEIGNKIAENANFNDPRLSVLSSYFLEENRRDGYSYSSGYSRIINFIKNVISDFNDETRTLRTSNFDRLLTVTEVDQQELFILADDIYQNVKQRIEERNHLDTKNLLENIADSIAYSEKLYSSNSENYFQLNFSEPEKVKEITDFLHNYMSEFSKDTYFYDLVRNVFLNNTFGGLEYDIKISLKPQTTKGYIEIPEHPFEKVDHWTRLNIRKGIRASLEEGYDGCMLIPEDLPRKIVGGEEGGNEYYYGTILPKLINQELKKFGLQLRYSKSEQARRSAHNLNVPWEIRQKEYFDKFGTNRDDVEKALEFTGGGRQALMKTLFEISETDRLEAVKRLFKRDDITFEESMKALEYAELVAKGKIPDADIKYNDIDEAPSETPASERSLMFLWHEANKPDEVKKVREGMPMYQRGEGEAKPSGEPETVGDITGQPVKKKYKRPTRGEMESGSPMPTMPTAGIFGKKMESLPIEGESFESKVMRDGTGEHRGYKVVKDRKDGGFKVFDPAGKLVKIPVVYRDKVSGTQTVRYENSAAMPNEAMDFIDHTLGGVADTQKDMPQVQKPISPAKVDARSGKPLNPEPARSEPAKNEAEVVKANVDAQGNSKYYIYNIGKDKNGKYFATDNSGQPISVFVESPTQAGPRVVSGNSTKDFNSLISQLDKKFDKARFARLAPVPHNIVQPSNKPVTAETPKPVAQAPAPTPVAKPTKTANVNTLPPAIQRTMAEKPVAPKPTEAKPVKPKKEPKVVVAKEETKPLEVISDEAYLEKQAKALGKGFLEMLRDPELKDYIINSLNADDNLTLKGTTENANTFDSRYSAVREGKKIVVYQNDYQSPITGVKYNKKPVAYVNNMQQAQMLIRRIEVERMMVMKANGMRSENPLAVMAGENPAFQSIANAIEIRNNAFMQMLLDMRDKGITPIMIDPRTLEPILTILPSEPYINPAPFLRQEFKNRIRGLIAENGTITEPMGLSIIDNASRFDMFQMAEIRGLDYNTKMRATRFRNTLGYEILKFNESTFKVFNPYKSSIAATSNLEDSIDEIIKDIHKNGLGQK